MEDQNNKKGYDDFFPSDDSKRSDELEKNDNAEVTASDQSELASDNSSKPSYYYTYGPLPGESHSASSISSNSGAGTGQQIEMPQQQLRSFTTSQQGGKGAWQVHEPRRTSFKSMFFSFLAGVLVVGALMYTADVRNWFTPGEAVTSQTNARTEGTPASASPSTSTGTGSAIAARPDNIADLFSTSSPAVVKIETFVNASSRRSTGSLLDDPFFRQFFGDDYPGLTVPKEEQGNRMQQTGIGTGFFFESDGYILTNQHVIGDADEIRVTVQGYDEPFKAKLLGSSFELDLAVVKIEDKKEFPTLPLGNSDDINIGDWVVAIGNPYGFDHTITVGVLSAKERPIDIQDSQGERHYKHLLQTDASINPGNSGGPLLNVKGEVIGINTAVSSQAQGIGFAIPTSTIREVLESLKNNKEIPPEPQPFIGAELYDVNEEFAQQLGMEKAEGSLVKSVYYNSPAYLADLKQFDVILGIDGKKFTNTTALIAEIQKRNVGDIIELNIIRKGADMNLEVEIGDKNVFGLK